MPLAGCPEASVRRSCCDETVGRRPGSRERMRWWRHGHRRAAVGATRVLTLLSLTNSFDRLARFYRADKSSLGHNHSPHYERHLGPRRFERILLLEIGAGGHRNRYAGGNSLHVWRDYFPRATIVGLDRFAKELPFLGRRVHVIQGDQSSPDDLAQIIARFGPPDVVIDDGSHRGSDVIAFIEKRAQLMIPRGARSYDSQTLPPFDVP
jgi:hypothetical protein